MWGCYVTVSQYKNMEPYCSTHCTEQGKRLRAESRRTFEDCSCKGSTSCSLQWKAIHFCKVSITTLQSNFVSNQCAKLTFCTFREAAALQSFPSDYRFFGSMSSQYSQVGNAVPICLATAISRSVIRVHGAP